MFHDLRHNTLYSTEVTAMDDEDTVVLTPEEKDKILKDMPEGNGEEEENKED